MSHRTQRLFVRQLIIPKQTAIAPKACYYENVLTDATEILILSKLNGL